MVRQDHDDDDYDDLENSSFSKIVKMTQQWSSLPKKIHLLFNLWIHLQVNAQESRDGQILFEVKTSFPYFGVKLSCVCLMFAYRKKSYDL